LPPYSRALPALLLGWREGLDSFLNWQAESQTHSLLD
jgi:hypothetical protein